MWELASSIAQNLRSADLTAALSEPLYTDLKSAKLLDTRRWTKSEVRRFALKGWKSNLGDDEWGIT